MLAGLLPLLATAIAFELSLRLGLIPLCNPFLEGCVSISRAARHDLPNILFRALLLPAAVLQGACWLLCPAWLRSLGAAPDRLQRSLPALGFAAAIFLILYGSFLAPEQGYRIALPWRGVLLHFTCIGMFVVAGQTQRLARAGVSAGLTNGPRAVRRTLLGRTA
jgi:hypothetical protein